MISENKFDKHIQSISKEDWKLLFDFIPLFKLEKTDWDISNFLEIYCVKLKLQVIFNWQNWEQGKFYLESQQFESLDMLNICKLTTLILRKDRFYEGYFIYQVQEGTLYNLMIRLKELAPLTDIAIHN